LAIKGPPRSLNCFTRLPVLGISGDQDYEICDLVPWEVSAREFEGQKPVDASVSSALPPMSVESSRFLSVGDQSTHRTCKANIQVLVLLQRIRNQQRTAQAKRQRGQEKSIPLLRFKNLTGFSLEDFGDVTRARARRGVGPLKEIKTFGELLVGFWVRTGAV
jgi:hypothetical protein